MIVEIIRWTLIAVVAVPLPGLAIAALVGSVSEDKRPTPGPWGDDA